MADAKIKRCAVYTRKSSEEGLEQDFNSLHAQREACEAFVVSQKSEGWRLVPHNYDDGGISGGTMERPALRRLLADVQENRVDVIVVYKVDRLTRSLADFAKMVEVFDKAGASFVAVTQQFNTTTSMGRLTLNVLLSFAQFEREVTGERIRDKIAASKRKGIWMGGNVPLGYDARERKLFIVPEEAERVRIIFERYLRCSGVSELQRELRERDIRPKTRPQRPSDHFWKGHLYTILRNPIYIGLIRHGDVHHPGQHEAIIDQNVWDAVQAKLTDHAVTTRSPRKSAPSPLKGKIFDESGRALMASHATKAGRRYRYYVSQPGEQGPDVGDWRLPALEIEARVSELCFDALENRSGIVEAGLKAGLSNHEVPALLEVVGKQSVFEQLQKVHLTTTALSVELRIDYRIPVTVARSVSMTMKRRGNERRLILQRAKANDASRDAALVRAVGKGLRWWELLTDGTGRTIKDIAKGEGVSDRYVSRLLPLALMAPDIVEAIATGRQPVELTAESTRSLAPPIRWSDQKEAIRSVVRK